MNKLCFMLIMTSFFSTAVFSSPYRLSYEREVLYFTAGGLMTLVGTVSEKDREGPSETELSELNKNDVPQFDRYYAGRWNKDAQNASDVFLAAGFAVPVSMMATERQDFPILATMYLQTFLITAGGVQLAKGSVTRYRPFVYGDTAPDNEKQARDANRSFFSGHTALASAGFVFTATVFSDYYPESTYKPYVWSAALAGSLFTGWLRMEGGKHFPSDVLVGLAWGSLVGYSVPALHRQKTQYRVSPFVSADYAGLRFLRIF